MATAEPTVYSHLSYIWRFVVRFPSPVLSIFPIISPYKLRTLYDGDNQDEMKTTKAATASVLKCRSGIPPYNRNRAQYFTLWHCNSKLRIINTKEVHKHSHTQTHKSQQIYTLYSSFDGFDAIFYSFRLFRAPCAQCSAHSSASVSEPIFSLSLSSSSPPLLFVVFTFFFNFIFNAIFCLIFSFTLSLSQLLLLYVLVLPGFLFYRLFLSVCSSFAFHFAPQHHMREISSRNFFCSI